MGGEIKLSGPDLTEEGIESGDIGSEVPASEATPTMSANPASIAAVVVVAGTAVVTVVDVVVAVPPQAAATRARAVNRRIAERFMRLSFLY